MGKQGNMKFIGTVENLIWYKWKDIYAVRTKPTRVQQTAATIEQGKLFGIASHTGAVLRSLLKPVLPNAKDRSMMRRFEQAIVQWLRTSAFKSHEVQTSLPFITGFEFSETSLLHKRFKLQVNVGINTAKNIAVELPEFIPVENITAPANTSSVIITIAAAACTLLADDSLNRSIKELTIPYNNATIPAQTIELPVTIDADIICVVILTLRYMVNGNISVDKRWLPAAVAGSIWGG